LDKGSTTSFFTSIDINSPAIFRYAFVVLHYCQRIPHDVGGENCFGAGGLSCWLEGLSTQPPERIG
jgi:hypothetical protein